jgi:hypothetical protein
VDGKVNAGPVGTEGQTGLAEGEVEIALRDKHILYQNNKRYSVTRFYLTRFLASSVGVV